MNRSKYGRCNDYGVQSKKSSNHGKRNLALAQKALDSVTQQFETKEQKLKELQDEITNLKSELNLEKRKQKTLGQELVNEKKSSEVEIDISSTNTCRLM